MYLKQWIKAMKAHLATIIAMILSGIVVAGIIFLIKFYPTAGFLIVGFLLGFLFYMMILKDMKKIFKSDQKHDEE
jgi:uncharacterized membrane protein